jgi:arabinose-5-phosphate isomerase
MDLLRELFDRQKKSLEHFFQNVSLEEVQRVVDALIHCSGTIVLTGVGKSGLVAQKIGATLNSTGTKACFLCPANALHGDIGILSSADILVAFSKSGQTEELLDILPHVEKKGVKIISVVSTKDSRLERRSALSVHLPLLRELCPFDLVPTVSTSIQLIFGDILSIALMQKKQFSVADFATNHPGGMLGKMIGLSVSDLMLKGDLVPFCSMEERLIDMLHELSVKRCGCLVIVDEQSHLLGIFTDGDLRRCIREKGPGALDKTLGELMTETPKSIEARSLALDAVRAMEQDPLRPVTVLPVLDGRRVVGLIRMHDILQTSLH